jgi:cell wall assembly regulator SMI1
MKVGDLVRDKTQPTTGTGIIIDLHRMNPGYQGRYSGCIAMFGDNETKFVGRDNVEVISER